MNNCTAINGKRPVDVLEQSDGFNSWFKGAIPIHDRMTSYTIGEDAHARYNQKS